MTEPDANSDSKAGDSQPSAKDKMREALDRKKEREHVSNVARRNTGAVHGSQVDGGGKRTFRRKSG